MQQFIFNHRSDHLVKEGQLKTGTIYFTTYLMQGTTFENGVST